MPNDPALKNVTFGRTFFIVLPSTFKASLLITFIWLCAIFLEDQKAKAEKMIQVFFGMMVIVPFVAIVIAIPSILISTAIIVTLHKYEKLELASMILWGIVLGALNMACLNWGPFFVILGIIAGAITAILSYIRLRYVF